MFVKITRVIIAEINHPLEGFTKAIQQEDGNAEGVSFETDFDDEGKVVDYLVSKQSTTVEEIPEG